MKVLDLQCTNGHSFEGWFASEEDFLSQCDRALVQCPMCGDASVQKKLSAPRLNLTASRRSEVTQVEAVKPSTPDQALVAAWLELSRRIVANTDDVGTQFAEEARKMHYGETHARAIRGQTTVEQARELIEEGIEVMPMLLPQVAKEPLQ